ncbi:MAG: Cys-tRNA(Pro) deacylase [Propionibacterium sp.]|nr:MAG: Cys-tRNA(Pro) deacylase [Propionibacterium sp.]
MTPAIRLLETLGIEYQVYSYHHNRATESYGAEAVAKLGLSAEVVFKTIIVTNEIKQLVTLLLPVDEKLDFKKVSKVISAKKVELADPKVVQRITGYVLGGVSPLGHKRRLVTVINESALSHSRIWVSAGKRGQEIALAPTDLASVLDAKFADLVR